MNATVLNHEQYYPNFPEFGTYEIDLSKVSSDLILNLQWFREFSQVPMTPSPRQRAWWRTDSSDSSSRHYAVNRLSDAGDLFPNKGRLLTAWTYALQWPAWGGVGVYIGTDGPDGDAWPMIHLDLRTYRRYKTLWAWDGEYYILQEEPEKFWRVLDMIALYEKSLR